MVDIYLQLALGGELNKVNGNHVLQKKDNSNKFELAYDQLFDHIVENLPSNNITSENVFIPKSLQRSKYKKDLINDTQFLNLEISLNSAIDFLTNKNECQSYLSPEEHEEIVEQFSTISRYLEQIDFKRPLSKKLYSLLHITESCMESILKVGTAKYNDKDFETSMAIFALLSSLDNENGQYWYRHGIAAVQMGKLGLALQAFAFTLYFNTEVLGARLFSADCYLKMNQIDDAKAEIQEAKSIVEKISPEQIWIDLLSDIDKRASTLPHRQSKM